MVLMATAGGQKKPRSDQEQALVGECADDGEQSHQQLPIECDSGAL